MKQNVVIFSGVVGIVGLLSLYYLRGRRKSNELTYRDVVGGDLSDVTVKNYKYQDLTAKITEKTVVFPGDPTFKSKAVSSIDESCAFGLSKMSMGNHMGTHIDFPAHVIQGGKTSSDYDIDHLFGEGLILELPKEAMSVSRSFLDQQNDDLKDKIVFFKTSNSKISKQAGFTENYVYIEPDAAKALLEKKVKIVGIDYISVDAYSEEKLPVHNLLLSNGVLIVENLELKGVDPGKCYLQIAPLNVDQVDGVPARVTMRR